MPRHAPGSAPDTARLAADLCGAPRRSTRRASAAECQPARCSSGLFRSYRRPRAASAPLVRPSVDVRRPLSAGGAQSAATAPGARRRHARASLPPLDLSPTGGRRSACSRPQRGARGCVAATVPRCLVVVEPDSRAIGEIFTAARRFMVNAFLKLCCIGCQPAGCYSAGSALSVSVVMIVRQFLHWLRTAPSGRARRSHQRAGARLSLFGSSPRTIGSPPKAP